MRLRMYVILLGGLIVAPALVVGSLILVIDGSVVDLTDWRDVVGLAVNAGLGLVVWLIGANIFRRTLQGNPESVSGVLGLIARFQPVLWLVGVGLGVFAGFGIIKSAHETRDSLAEMYCSDVFEDADPRQAKCLGIALKCSDEVATGPCGKIESTAGADACVQAYDAARNALSDEQRAELPDVYGGDYERGMQRICLLEKSSSPEHY